VPKVKPHGWSVVGHDAIKPNMPPEMVEQIKQQANDQSISDVFGADWREHVDAHGNPQEQGIGSTAWLLGVDEAQAERHYAAIARFVGPAAAQAERERIARLKGKNNVLGAYRSFLRELRRAYPYLYDEGEFDTTIATLERLSNATVEEAIELSDRCVAIARKPAPAVERLFFVREAIKQFGREMSVLDS
jgi:hypothetical protein